MKMKQLALLLVTWLLLLPALALAEGEDDPLWARSSYEKKVFKVGQRILQANGIQEKLTFRITRDNSAVNAYAHRPAGNEVWVEKGLLNLIESDDELAAVLGHEMAHLLRRHWEKKIPGKLGAGLMGVLVPEVGDTASVLLNPYSQDLESEADRVGMDLMVKANYNPVAMETVMTKIVGDQPKVLGLMSTHPNGSKRIADIRMHIASRYPQFLDPRMAKDWSTPWSQLPGQTYGPTTQPNWKLGRYKAPGVASSWSADPQSAQTSEPTSALMTRPRNVQPTRDRTALRTPTPHSVDEQSLASVLLTLQPDQLTILKAVQQNRYLEERDLMRDYLQDRTAEHREILLNDLESKRILRILGSEPQRVFLFTEWAEQAFQATP